MRPKEVYVGIIREFKHLPNRTLAKKLFTMFPERFKNVESARNTVRSIRGAIGTKDTGFKAVPDLIRTKEEIEASNNYLPKSEENKFATHQLPTNVKKWLMLYDIHSPYHDEKALWSAIAFGRKEKCDGVFKGGDSADCYQVSSFVKDPRKRSLVDEVQISAEIDEVILKEIKPKSFIWKLGNHEFRLERYIMARTPELLGLDGISFKSIFKCDENKITVIPAQDPIRHKTLSILHGHEFGGSIIAPVNPARGMFLRARECVISGHSHRTSEHTEKTVLGTTITCWSVGCLADLHPEYKPLNNYNHGFGILTIEEGKFWNFKNYRIIDGKVV